MEYYDIHTHRTHHDPHIREIENIILRDGAGLPPLAPGRFYSAGIHPRCIPPNPPETALIRRIEEQLRHPRIVAVGECGLDTFADSARSLQNRIFQFQITLSETLRKPLIIHCVKAWDEIIRLHGSLRPAQTWIIHGFRGKPQLAGMLLRHGMWLSVGIHFPLTLAQAVPLDRILPETDDDPEPVTAVYERMARSWNIPLPEVQAQMRENVTRLFPALSAR